VRPLVDTILNPETSTVRMRVASTIGVVETAVSLDFHTCQESDTIWYDGLLYYKRVYTLPTPRKKFNLARRLATLTGGNWHFSF